MIPKFRPDLRVETVAPDLLFFIDDSGYHVIKSKLMCRIAPLINGKRTAHEIARKTKSTDAEIEASLLLFDADGYLSHKETGMEVFEVDDYLQEGLEQINRNHLRTGEPWMMIKRTGNVRWFGPIFTPAAGPCWKCLALRLTEKRRVDAFLKAHGRKPDSDHKPRKIEMKFLRKSRGQRYILTLDLRSLKQEKHYVVRRDDCPECGKAAAFPEPIRLAESTAKPFRFEQYKHHISFRTGIIDEFRFVTAKTSVIHVAVADHIFIPNLDKNTLLTKGLTRKSWGKGLTREQARMRAVCEALERYSGILRTTDFRISKNQEELKDQAIPLNSCLNFSEAQYASRAILNKTADNHDWIPERFNPKQTIDWTPVWSLTHQSFKYLPTAYCYYGYPWRGPKFCRADSSGNAAGNTQNQAILHGFLELVERDCAAMWWFNRAVRPSLEITSFPSNVLKQWLSFYKSSHRLIWAFDITNDFQIPCFVALSTKTDGSELYLGLGAHFDPRVALIRAISELNQFVAARMNNKSSAPTRSMPEESFLYPNQSFSSEYRDYNKIGSKRSVRSCVQLANRLGLEILVLDQTRQDIGLPVVKVIVPGMRQIWRRFAPGRLYDVPVQLGWLKRPLSEKQLNPHSMLV